MKSRFVVLLLTLAVAAHAQNEWPRPDLGQAAAPVREAVEDAQQRMRALLDQSDDQGIQANAWMALGDVYLAHEYQPEARAAYARAVDVMPDRSELRYRLALIAILQGDDDVALSALEESLSLPHPDVMVPGRVRRGRILLDRGRNDEALADFERALRIDPDHPAALEGLGRARLALGDAEGAIEPLLRALELEPGATRVYTPLGMAFRNLGETESARRALSRAGEGEASLHDPVLDRVQALSRSPQFFLESGLAQADQRQFGRAAELIGRAVSLDPDDPALLSPYGQVLIEAGLDELAREVFKRLVAAERMSAMDYAYLARLEARTGNAEQAEQAYAQALLSDPELDLAREGRARMWLAQGHFLAAAGGFSELAESMQQPDLRATAEYWLGLAWLGDGNCAGALAALEAAAARVDQPGSALLEALVRARSTCPGVDPNLMAQALEWGEALYDARPGLESSATLAMVYAALGRHDDAVDLQTQAIFEALKQATLEARPELQANLERYRNGEGAERAYAATDPVWSLR